MGLSSDRRSSMCEAVPAPSHVTPRRPKKSINQKRGTFIGPHSIPRWTPLQTRVRLNRSYPNIDGEIVKKRSRRRAEAQRIVTKKILYRLHHPVGRPSRLQGLSPGAL